VDAAVLFDQTQVLPGTGNHAGIQKAGTWTEGWHLEPDGMAMRLCANHSVLLRAAYGDAAAIEPAAAMPPRATPASGLRNRSPIMLGGVAIRYPQSAVVPGKHAVRRSKNVDCSWPQVNQGLLPRIVWRETPRSVSGKILLSLAKSADCAA
jgi:hypothetical protein